MGVCVVPFKQNVKYKTWISGYSAKVDTDNQVPVLSTSAGLTAPMLARCRGKMSENLSKPTWWGLGNGVNNSLRNAHLLNADVRRVKQKLGD